MKNILYLAAAFLWIVSCEPIDFDDPSTLTNEEAQLKIKSLGYVLTKSSVQTTFNTTTSNAGGSHFSLWADQSTNTNGSQSWWDFANEPRLRLNNNSAYRGNAAVRDIYSNFYQANLDATKVVDMIENKDVVILDDNGNDRTADCLIGAYYAKGISQGSLGVIFDRGLVVDEVDLSTRSFPHSYKDLIENGIKHLDRALKLIAETPDLEFDFLTGVTIAEDDLVKLINSFAARILSSEARDITEAASLSKEHWERVYQYASNGFTEDFLIPTISGGYYNALVDVLERPHSGAGYVPVDIKIPFLANKDNTTPTTYPTDNSIVLPPIETDDERFYDYFTYTGGFGILMEARGRGLFSNYMRSRWMYPRRTTLSVEGAINPYFLAEEVRLLRAESKLWLGDYEEAARELNAEDARRKSKGSLPDVLANPVDLTAALHYEYAIEIDAAGGIFIPFTFMRRHNLLQGGTPTQFPVPQIQLELIGLETYTFGGAANEGERGIYDEVGTAEGNGWKELN